MVVGILALQGDVREHDEILRKLGVQTVHVKLPRDLKRIDRLIIPGGESTTIGKLLVTYKLIEPIRGRIKKGMPVWGTCAGAILLAKHVVGGAKAQPQIDLMDITARRNAFGRQLASFEAHITMKEVGRKPIPVLFIRAPIFEKLGKGVKVLARLPNKKIIAVQQGKMLATVFHPELAGATELHRYFLSL